MCDHNFFTCGFGASGKALRKKNALRASGEVIGIAITLSDTTTRQVVPLGISMATSSTPRCRHRSARRTPAEIGQGPVVAPAFDGARRHVQVASDGVPPAPAVKRVGGVSQIGKADGVAGHRAPLHPLENLQARAPTSWN